MRIIVSHPGKQHVYHLIEALSNTSDLFFYTTVAFNNKRIVKSKLIPQALRNFIGKRYLQTKKVKLVNVWLAEAAFYFKKKFTDFDKLPALKLSAWQKFDNVVASQISSIKPDIFIGYETSSLQSFKKAKSFGAITILDLAYVHYKMNLDVRITHNAFAETFKNEDFYCRENRLKEEELANVDYVLCLSSLAEKSLLNAGIAEDKIYRYNLGVNIELFKAKSSKSKNGRLRLIYVGGITARKGLGLLSRICERMNDSVELVLIGPVIEPDLFQRLISIPNIIYKGYMSQPGLLNEYHAADIFVFPSYLDSWGQVVLEAMACGLPVIVSDNTGAKDAVEKGGGLIIPTGDSNELEKAIRFFLDDRSQIEQLGIAARKSAEMYSLDNYAIQVNNIIDNIVKDR